MLSLDTAFTLALGLALTAAVHGWLWERRERRALTERVAKLEEAQERSGNRLHWQAVEDERARGINAFILMSNAAKDIADALDTLAPHMRKPK